MLRLSFVRLIRHLIVLGRHIVHFLVGASHLMGVAAWRYRQFANRAHMHTCGGGARVASPSNDALRFVT